MNNPRLRLPALIGAIAAITAGSANADLLAYRFATPSGEQKSLSSGAIYANPVGNMTFSVSAGIDRKVKVSILRADGSVVSSAISSLLGATDRITVGGNSYYGAELVIPAPAEGEYQIKSEILSSQGGVIQSASERLVIDTTAPIISGDFTFNVSGWTWGRIDIFGPDNINNTISIGGITDAGSGAVSAKYFAIDPQGVKRSKAVALTKNTPASITFYANDASGGDVAPTNRAEYEIGVEVADAAGNIAKKTRVSAIDRTMPPYSVEVWNSQSGVWQPYESAASYENPIKFRTKIAKADHVDFNGTKYGLKFSYNNQDANFVYNEGAVAIPSSSQSYWNIQTLSGVYQNFYFSSLNGVKLGGAAQQGPQAIDFSYGVAGMPMVSGTSPTIKTPSSIDRYTTTVEPRPYDQTVSVNGASCVIPAGSQSCTLNPNVTFTSGRGYIPYPVYVRNGSGSLTQHATYLYTYWDFNPPVINSAVWDASTKTAAVRVIDSDRINNWQIGMWDTRDIGVDAIDEKGGRIPLKLKKSYDESYNTKNREFTTTGIPDGKYTLEAVSVDTYGNTARKVISQIVIDNTAPNLVIQAPQGGVPSLDDIQINVTDALSDKPSITSVNLKGGPSSDNVFLSVRAISANLFKLEYPVMFPSLKAGESYSLTVIAQDDQGNQATKGINFNYTPRQVRLADGMDGKLMIPAVTQEFIHADGSKIIETEPLTLNDGSTVTGSYDVFATLRTDAKVPLVVNGVRIEPGQTMGIMSKHNFGASKGRLSIPMKPAVPDVVGSSGLLVTTAAPNSPILVLDVTTWKPTAKLSAESWMVRQVIDPVKISALPDAGVPCRFTSKEEEAKRSDPIRDPVCLLQWDRIPDEAEQSTQESDGLKLAGLVGQAVSLGEQPLEYSLYLFSGDGAKVKVGGGSRNLTVTSAYGSVGYTPGPEVAQVNRIIETFDVRMSQNLGPACSVTLSADQAKKDAANKASGSISRSCLFEWQAIPDGLVQDQGTTTPGLSGTVTEKMQHALGWRVSIYSKNGTRVTLNDQTFAIDAIDPPAPTVDLTSKYSFKDNIYMVPMLGDYLGDVTITSERADLDVAISRNADTLESETFSPGWGSNTKVYRRLNTDQRGLWEETTYKVKAAYNKVPEVKTEAVYRAVSVPSYNLVPVVEVAGDTAIDTQALPVQVKIQDQYKPNEVFDAATMGSWKVRLIRQMAYNKTEALTDFVNATNGTASFAVDLSKVDTTSVRIVAEAELVSPFEGYSRIVQSTRPAFLTVLRGGAIGAEVGARRLSGEAPFTAVFKLALSDRQDYRATGDVVWDVSSDGGATWESTTPEERYKYQMVKVFEKGSYKVRAKVINRNSSAEAYTEVVDVIAYDKPKLEVKGPQTLFVGSEGTFSTRLTVKNEEIGAENAVVEWSTDGGKAWDKQGPTLTLNSDKDTRIKLWARVRSGDAPANDDYAYRVAKTAVEFRVVKPPRPYLSGPSVIETGKTYTFKATTSLPYKGMDVQVKGVFTLPNGQQVEGDTAQYTPSAEDLTKERVETTYTAWIEGFREQGAEATHSMYSRVWEYVWPRFGMQVRKTANVAPATIIVTARPIGFSGKLEEAVYEWTLPEGAAIEDQKQPAARVFTMGSAGEYLVKLKVRDARGNETELEEPVVLGEAEQYVIDLQYSGSNPDAREPLDVLLRPYISGGHPRDRILTRQYSVDGKPLESAGFYGRTTLQAGEHEIKLKATSEMGKDVEGKLVLKVAENKLPTCTVRSRETIGSWIVYAGCEDPDGRMKSYQWTVGGEVQAITADRLTISKGKDGVMPTIALVGVDDSGGRSEVVSLN
ncbi:DUF4165 domain-containing protein [Enterobacter hormaechei]|uniref:Ig-like domain-containing protein n=5 Tax=Gammaproteobacteria TaxID=1236 RepID=UPI00125E3831|nr:Ig-like domain-containing protein [Enterobacter hormaechei]QFH85705.1 DUF4165 domain-containing protein [Enterobacter hormaechei]